jgi:hypothetical protein
MRTRTRTPLHFDAAQATRNLQGKSPRDRQAQRIAALAGITLSTLQHHFGNQQNSRGRDQSAAIRVRARTIGVLIGIQLNGLMIFYRHASPMKLPLARGIAAMNADWMEEIAGSCEEERE